MSFLVEIKSAEGGDHAKHLVEVQADIYTRLARKHCL